MNVQAQERRREGNRRAYRPGRRSLSFPCWKTSMTAPCLAITSGLPTTRGIDLLGNLHLELRRTVFLGGCWRRWALSLIVVVTTNDGNRTADSRNHCDTRRLAKCAIVSVPTHKAILPCACLRSLTTRAGCGAPCTYKRALSPCTSIFSLVHSPGTTSA